MKLTGGVYGYPKENVTQIAVTAMPAYEDRFELIIACCFSDEGIQMYRYVLAENNQGRV